MRRSERVEGGGPYEGWAHHQMGAVSGYLGGENCNPLRGASYEEMARAFLQKFREREAIGDQELDDFFTEWVSGYDPEMRAEYAKRLRSASTHKRMNAGGDYAYTVFSDFNRHWLIRRSLEAIGDGMAVGPVFQLIESRRSALRYWAESIDLTDWTPEQIEVLRMAVDLQDRALLSSRDKMLEVCRGTDDIVAVIRRMRQQAGTADEGSVSEDSGSDPDPDEE